MNSKRPLSISSGLEVCWIVLRPASAVSVLTFVSVLVDDAMTRLADQRQVLEEQRKLLEEQKIRLDVQESQLSVRIGFVIIIISFNVFFLIFSILTFVSCL